MGRDLSAARERMVAEDLAGRGITDRRVLDAMRAVPREAFVPPELRDRAYDDEPLPIGWGQTISQPYIVALMSEALGIAGTGACVLEVGTGSGYQAAVLAAMGARVVTIERQPDLAARAQRILGELGFGDRVRVHCGDGTLGLDDEAPYDGILVTAGAPIIPRPLVAQLAPHGCLVLPIGDPEVQTLVRIVRGADGSLTEEYLGSCRFVKLHGAYGWEER